MGENMPGLFFVPGVHTLESIRRDHKDKLEAAQVRQKNWYTALVRMADALWSRSNGNPLAISEDMKMAAKDLNLINKEWLKDSQTMDLVRCQACGSLKNPLYPICSNCKAITDPVKAKELGLVFAQ